MNARSRFCGRRVDLICPVSSGVGVSQRFMFFDVDGRLETWRRNYSWSCGASAAFIFVLFCACGLPGDIHIARLSPPQRREETHFLCALIYMK